MRFILFFRNSQDIGKIIPEIFMGSNFKNGIAKYIAYNFLVIFFHFFVGGYPEPFSRMNAVKRIFDVKIFFDFIIP